MGTATTMNSNQIGWHPRKSHKIALAVLILLVLLFLLFPQNIFKDAWRIQDSPSHVSTTSPLTELSRTSYSLNPAGYFCLNEKVLRECPSQDQPGLMRPGYGVLRAQ